METFKDEGQEGAASLVLGGKVLVIDVDFSIDKTNPLQPKLHVVRAKTAFAIPSNTTGSLDTFLAESIQEFCSEVQKPQDVRSPEIAAKLGGAVVDQLKYLVHLDKLAARQQDGGVRWFVDIDQLCPTLEQFAKEESEMVASWVVLSCSFRVLMCDFKRLNHPSGTA